MRHGHPGSRADVFRSRSRQKGACRPRRNQLLPLQPGHSFRVLILASACFFVPYAHAVALAETPEEKGLRIAREASARNDGYEDFTAGMKMVLRDRHGRESVRQMRFKVLEVPGDGDKSLFVFDRPGTCGEPRS